MTERKELAGRLKVAIRTAYSATTDKAQADIIAKPIEDVLDLLDSLSPPEGVGLTRWDWEYNGMSEDATGLFVRHEDAAPIIAAYAAEGDRADRAERDLAEARKRIGELEDALRDLQIDIPWVYSDGLGRHRHRIRALLTTPTDKAEPACEHKGDWTHWFAGDGSEGWFICDRCGADLGPTNHGYPTPTDKAEG